MKMDSLMDSPSESSASSSRMSASPMSSLLTRLILRYMSLIWLGWSGYLVPQDHPDLVVPGQLELLPLLELVLEPLLLVEPRRALPHFDSRSQLTAHFGVDQQFALEVENLVAVDEVVLDHVGQVRNREDDVVRAPRDRQQIVDFDEKAEVLHAVHAAENHAVVVEDHVALQE